MFLTDLKNIWSFYNFLFLLHDRKIKEKKLRLSKEHPYSIAPTHNVKE